MARKKKDAEVPPVIGPTSDGPSPEVIDALADLATASGETLQLEHGRVTRISGDELKARLRQERREARLAEKGY